jgi:hypothetical protein
MFSNVNVSGNWSGGSSGTSNCTTDDQGKCQVSKRTRGESLTFTVTGISGNGSEYVPNENHDQDGDSNGISITINKDGSPSVPNTPPLANDDSGSTDEDSPVTIVVLTNDSDPDANSFFISTFDGTSTSGASISKNADDTFDYDPTSSSILQSLNEGNSQFDTFSYTIEDEHGATDSAVVTINVSGIYDEPSTLAIDSITPTEVTRGEIGVVIDVIGNGFSGLTTVSFENGGEMYHLKIQDYYM